MVSSAVGPAVTAGGMRQTSEGEMKRIRKALASADAAAGEVEIAAGAVADLINDLRGDGLEITIKVFGCQIPIAIGIKTAEPEVPE